MFKPGDIIVYGKSHVFLPELVLDDARNNLYINGHSAYRGLNENYTFYTDIFQED